MQLTTSITQYNAVYYSIIHSSICTPLLYSRDPESRFFVAGSRMDLPVGILVMDSGSLWSPTAGRLHYRLNCLSVRYHQLPRKHSSSRCSLSSSHPAGPADTGYRLEITAHAHSSPGVIICILPRQCAAFAHRRQRRRLQRLLSSARLTD